MILCADLLRKKVELWRLIVGFNVLHHSIHAIVLLDVLVVSSIVLHFYFHFLSPLLYAVCYNLQDDAASTYGQLIVLQLTVPPFTYAVYHDIDRQFIHIISTKCIRLATHFYRRAIRLNYEIETIRQLEIYVLIQNHSIFPIGINEIIFSYQLDSVSKTTLLKYNLQTRIRLAMSVCICVCISFMTTIMMTQIGSLIDKLFF